MIVYVVVASRVACARSGGREVRIICLQLGLVSGTTFLWMVRRPSASTRPVVPHMALRPASRESRDDAKQKEDVADGAAAIAAPRTN